MTKRGDSDNPVDDLLELLIERARAGSSDVSPVDTMLEKLAEQARARSSGGDADQATTIYNFNILGVTENQLNRLLDCMNNNPNGSYDLNADVKTKSLEDKLKSLKSKSSLKIGTDPNVNNVNIRRMLRNEELKTIIACIENNPDAHYNFNILGVRDTSKKKGKTTPRVTVKQLREYIEQRADEIVKLIQGIQIPQPNQPAQPVSCKYDEAVLRQLLATFAQDIQAQYRAIDGRLSGLEGTASTIAGAAGRIESGVGRVEGLVSSTDGRLTAIEGAVSSLDGKADQILTGQAGLRQEHDGLSEDHRELRTQHAELRKGQRDILGKLNDLEVLYTNLDSAVRAIQPYDTAALVQIINDGFDDLKQKISGIQTQAYDDTQLKALIDRKFDDLRRRVDAIPPGIGDIKITLAGMQTKLNGLHNYSDKYIRGQLSGLDSTLTTMQGKLNSLDNNDRALMATVSGIDKTIAAMQAKLGTLHNYKDAQLRQLVGDLNTKVANMQGTLNGLHNYSDRSLKDMIQREIDNLRQDVGKIKPYDDTTLKTAMDQRFAELRAKIDGIKPCDNSNLLTSLTDMVSILGEVKGKVDGLAQTDTAVMSSLSGITGALARIEGNLGGNVYDELKQLINDKYGELVGKYGELTTLIAQKVGEIQAHITAQLSPYATEDDIRNILSGELAKLPDPITKDELKEIIDDKLKDLPKGGIDEEALGKLLDEKLEGLPYLKRQDLEDVLAEKLGELSYVKPEDLERILAEQLANLNCATQEDLQGIYNVNRTFTELLGEIFDKLNSIEQNYGQQQPPAQQPAPQHGQPVNNAQLDAIQTNIKYIREQLENRDHPCSYTDNDRRLLADIFHNILDRLGETRGEGNRRFDELKNDISQLRQELLQGYQRPGQQAPAQGDGAPQADAAQGDQQAGDRPQRDADQRGDQQADERPQPDGQQQDQERDESPRLEDEQQPVGDRVERQLEPAPSVEVGEQGIKAFYKASEKAKRLVLGRDRLLRETYLRAEQGLVSADGREVDISKLKEYAEKRAFENRAVGCIATLAKQLYGDYNDVFVESDVMTSLVGFDRTFVRRMVDQAGENLTFDNYYQSVTEASKETRERISRIPMLCLDEPHREKVVNYTGTEGRVNPESLSAGDMAALLGSFKEYGEIPTRAIKDRPYFIPQRQAA
jgi:hypothetical protein